METLAARFDIGDTMTKLSAFAAQESSTLLPVQSVASGVAQLLQSLEADELPHSKTSHPGVVVVTVTQRSAPEEKLAARAIDLVQAPPVHKHESMLKIMQPATAVEGPTGPGVIKRALPSTLETLAARDPLPKTMNQLATAVQGPEDHGPLPLATGAVLSSMLEAVQAGLARATARPHETNVSASRASWRSGRRETQCTWLGEVNDSKLPGIGKAVYG